MERVFIVEVMGRDCGAIALGVALGGGCEEVIIPERKYDLQEICHGIVEGNLRGKASWIIVVAEGAGSAQEIAKKITELTNLETRALVLGHIQRGGRPTAASRDMALRYGEAAVKALLAGKADICVGLSAGRMAEVGLAVATQKKAIDVEKWYELIKILT
jgi:6-phosphofructokinase 1